MPTSLNILRQKLLARMAILDKAFGRLTQEHSTLLKADRYALREGLISALWQSWSAFCRSTLLTSAAGGLDGGGNVIASPHAGRSEMELAFIARELAMRRPVGAIRALVGNHQEPTWGDLNKINLIASGFLTSNRNNLLSGFGVALRMQDLQMCRNACAHLSPDRFNDLKAAKVRYVTTNLTHPTDFVFWIDPLSGDPVWRSWLSEMSAVAGLAAM